MTPYFWTVVHIVVQINPNLLDIWLEDDTEHDSTATIVLPLGEI